VNATPPVANITPPAANATPPVESIAPPAVAPPAVAAPIDCFPLNYTIVFYDDLGKMDFRWANFTYIRNLYNNY
jgi:hypothetical protein